MFAYNLSTISLLNWLFLHDLTVMFSDDDLSLEDLSEEQRKEVIEHYIEGITNVIYNDVYF